MAGTRPRSDLHAEGLLEAVLNTRHDVWASHTNKDRGWVITGGTNLYSQEQFPNMDLALTFHIGLILRIPRYGRTPEDDLRIVPFGPGLR